MALGHWQSVRFPVDWADHDPACPAPQPEDLPAFIIYRLDPLRVRYMKEWALDYHEVTVG